MRWTQTRGQIGENPVLTGSVTVLSVRDIKTSVTYYRDALGFAVTFQYGEPAFYVCLCRDEVSLHLLAAHKSRQLPGNGAVCVFVNDVDALHAELTARGAEVL